MPWERRWGRILVLSGLTVLASACAKERLVSVPPGLASIHDEEWTRAQTDLETLHPPVDGDPFAVAITAFRVEPESEPFYCGETGLHAVLLVWGCFRAEPGDGHLGVIRYVPGKEALRHEARHAILFALGDERWADVGH